MTIQRPVECDYGERQQSVNDFLSYTFGNEWITLSHPSKVEGLVVLIGKENSDTLVTPS